MTLCGRVLLSSLDIEGHGHVALAKLEKCLKHEFACLVEIAVTPTIKKNSLFQ
jgi:hypothetical protein